MNYKPVVAGNQSNSSTDPPFSSSSKDSPDAGFKPSGEEEKNDAEDPGNKDSEVLKDNVVDENIVYGCDDDRNMPKLEEIVYSDDDEYVGAEADINNLDTRIPVSPIPTTRIHKDHLVEQIIGDIYSAPQTKRMTKSVTEQSMFKEPKKVIQALKDPSWIEAMQEEFLQFKLQQATEKVKTVNGEVQIQALMDKKKVIITETSVRSDLQFKDAKGTECLPNAIIFEQLTLMGAKTTAWNEFSSTMASAVICLATNQKFNFSKYIFDNMVKNLEGGVKFLMYPRFVQVFLDKQVEGMSKHKEIYVTPSHTKKVFANMKRQGKDFSGRDTPLFPTMIVQAQEQVGEGSEIPTDSHHTPTTTQPSTSKPQKKQSRRKQRKDTKDPQLSGPTEPVTDDTKNVASVPTHSNDPLLSGEDRLKLNELMELCTSLSQRVLDLENTKTSQAAEITELKKRVKKLEGKRNIRSDLQLEDAEDVTLADETHRRNDEEIFDTCILDGEEVFAEQDVVEKEVSAADPVHTLIEIKAAKPKARGAKDKGKAKMVEPKKPLKKKDQIMFDKEVAQKLQAQIYAEWKKKESFKTKRRRCKQLLNRIISRDEKYMEIVPDDEVAIDAIPLATNPPIIVDWKIIKESLARGGNIDREDLETLWKLAKAKHGLTRPEEAYEIDCLWKKYPLTPATITDMLNKKLQADHWNEMSYQLLKLRTKQLKNPRNV
ncbi:hypothetical protein Tco_0294337 [Tanacetum coccineum]